MATPRPAPRKKARRAGLFLPADYVPFMLGTFVLGGLLAIPFACAPRSLRDYLIVLPWSLGSAVVLFVSIRRDGRVLWIRAAPAIVALVVVGYLYGRAAGQPMPAVLSMLGFGAMLVAGYVGLGVGRLVRLFRH